MGIKDIHIWDNDILEPRNCPTEVAYSESDVGKSKVEAARNMVNWLVGNSNNLTIHKERVNSKTQLSGIVISGVDSMKSRKEIWGTVKENYLDIPLYIDGRSGGETIQILSVVMSNFQAQEDYETWLFSDDDAAKIECGARNIGYIAMGIAAEIGCLITKFSRDLPIEFNITRDYKYE